MLRFCSAKRKWRGFPLIFPCGAARRRVDDRRVVGRVVYVIKQGLQWKDAPKEYEPPKTLCNHFVRWSRLGVFAALAGKGPEPERTMIDPRI